VLVLNHGEEKEVGLPSTLLTGQYSEEESARYFQEALREWRGERSHEEEQRSISQAVWTPLRSGELQRHCCRHTNLMFIPVLHRHF